MITFLVGFYNFCSEWTQSFSLASFGEIDRSGSDGIENHVRVLYFEDDDSIWRTLFEYFEERILCLDGRCIKMPENIDIFSLVWPEFDIDDTSSHGFYVEFFFVLRNIIGIYLTNTGFDELLIRENMFFGES